MAKNTQEAAPESAEDQQATLLDQPGEAPPPTEQVASADAVADAALDAGTSQDETAGLEPEQAVAEPEYIEVLVLRDEPAYGLRCGEILMLDVVTAEQLYNAGGIDPEPKAVAAAKASLPGAATPDVIEADD